MSARLLGRLSAARLRGAAAGCMRLGPHAALLLLPLPLPPPMRTTTVTLTLPRAMTT